MRRSTWPAIAWSTLILVAVAIPGAYVPGPVWSLDKVVHFALFAGFAWFWMRGAPGAWARIAAVGLLYGTLTEVAQSILPGERTGDPMDAVANVAGLAAGLLAGAVVNRIRPPHAAPGNRGADEMPRRSPEPPRL